MTTDSPLQGRLHGDSNSSGLFSALLNHPTDLSQSTKRGVAQKKAMNFSSVFGASSYMRRQKEVARHRVERSTRTCRSFLLHLRGAFHRHDGTRVQIGVD